MAPIIFLLGPPGAGKSTLGRRACQELGLAFFDLADAPGPAPADGDRRSDLAQLARLVAERAADVVEVPWQLQQERPVLAWTRQTGVSLLLWAHPEDMQVRSGRAERLFTPVPRLTSRGGFGRSGTGCREFRQVDRACSETVLLVDLPVDEAAEVVADCIDEIRATPDESPIEREGLSGWAAHWRHDHGARPGVAKVIVDAMARYLSHLRAQGSSPRTLASVRSDLNAAGILVLMYDAPKGGRVLEHFAAPPWTREFERKFTDRPTLVARYHRSLAGFADFLTACGDLPKDED